MVVAAAAVDGVVAAAAHKDVVAAAAEEGVVAGAAVDGVAAVVAAVVADGAVVPDQVVVAAAAHKDVVAAAARKDVVAAVAVEVVALVAPDNPVIAAHPIQGIAGALLTLEVVAVAGADLLCHWNVPPVPQAERPRLTGPGGARAFTHES